MGTTLHAIVEEAYLCDTAIWNVISEWHLDKDYRLMIYLDEHPHEEGWPSNISFCAQYMIDRDTSDRRQTLYIPQLPPLNPNSSNTYRSLLNSLQDLNPNTIRILFYRM